jgi:DnaJ-class molecular chaperone
MSGIRVQRPCDDDPDACVCDNHPCDTCDGEGIVEPNPGTLYADLGMPVDCPDCDGGVW